MIDYVIGQDFELPSKGKVYNGRNVTSQVKLRSMTTAEEMKRLNHSDRAHKMMSEVIDDCLVEKIGISSYDLCIADYQYLLHKLRIVTYGTKYKISSTCPYCGTSQIAEVDLSEIPVKEFNEEELAKYTEFVLPACNKRIKLRMQSPRILDDISSKARELKKKNPKFVGDPAFLFTLSSLIQEVDGKKLEEFQLEEFVKKLQMIDANYILKAAQSLIGLFGLNTDIENTCSFCGLDYGSSFRITSEFFGPSIDFG